MRAQLRSLAGAGLLAAAALACNLPARPPKPTAIPEPAASATAVEPTAPPEPAAPAETTSPAPTAAPGDGPLLSPAPEVASRLAEVSAERLLGDVTGLAAIESRHFGSATREEAALYIYETLGSLPGEVAVAYDPFTAAYEGLQAEQVNVVARFPGTDPAAGIVLVGAHYDSRGPEILDTAARAPGADDNASGVAVLLEIGRVLAGSEPHPATVVLVAFAAEEIGTQGSRHFAGQALASGEDIRAVLVLDMVGNAAGPDGEGSIRLFSAPPDGSPSRQLARAIDLFGRVYLPDFDVSVEPAIDRPYRYSDHVPFSEAGYPAVRFIEPLEDASRQHNAEDLPERLSPTYMQQVTRLALAAVLNLAASPPPPPGVILEAGALAWEPVEGAAGYAVGVRSLESHAFEQVITTRDARLPLDELDETLLAGPYAVSVAATGPEGRAGPFSPELVSEPSVTR